MKSIIYFTQDLENCIYCRRMEPVITKLIEDGVQIEKIEAFTPEGEHNPLNAQWGVMSTPTAFVLDDEGNILSDENGKEIGRVVGARPYSFMQDLLKD